MNPEDVPLEPLQLAEACREVEGLVASGVRVGEELLEQATRLRAIANVGV